MIELIIEALSAIASDNMEEFVAQRIRSLGRDFIREALDETPFGAVRSGYDFKQRLGEFLEPGGIQKYFREKGKEGLNKLKEELLGSAKGKPKIVAAINKIFDEAYTDQQNQPQFQKSHIDYLADAWMHDWRSQPRNIIGEWVPGRLTYPVVVIGKRPYIGRRVKQRRKQKRYYRKIGRLKIKSIVSSWGKTPYGS